MGEVIAYVHGRYLSHLKSHLVNAISDRSAEENSTNCELQYVEVTVTKLDITNSE